MSSSELGLIIVIILIPGDYASAPGIGREKYRSPQRGGGGGLGGDKNMTTYREGDLPAFGPGGFANANANASSGGPLGAPSGSAYGARAGATQARGGYVPPAALGASTLGAANGSPTNGSTNGGRKTPAE